MFVVSAAAASVLSILVCSLYKVSVPLHDNPVVRDITDKSLFNTFIKEIVYNPIEALIHGKYLAILLWAAFIGIFVRQTEATTKQVVNDLAAIATKITRVILELAPFGVMGLMFHDMTSATSSSGSSLLMYKDLIILFLVISAIMFFIVNPLIVMVLTRRNAFRLMPALEKSIIYSFFTCSSAANIPVNQQIAEEKNVTRQLSTVAIPLGATIHKPGSIITINMLALVALFSYNPAADITVMQYIELGIVSVISSACIAGVANGSLMLIPIACRIFDIPDHMILSIIEINVLLTFIRDSFATTLNSSSDLLFTLAVDERHKTNTDALVDNIINAKHIKRREENENAIKKALNASQNTAAEEESDK
jgi:serine/threonine transporter